MYPSNGILESLERTMTSFYNLYCLVDRNKIGTLELVPLCNKPGFEKFYIGARGKYSRIRSNAVVKKLA